MLEIAALGLFIAGLLLCIGLNLSIFYALFFGLGVFFVYGLYQKHGFTEMLKMSVKGVKTVRNIMLVFIMIGALTAIWRAAGTIPYIIYYSTRLIFPQIFILATFILCCLISVLTGTSFGTAATMGVICMTMGRTMGISPALIGGAVLSGGFFGDRCSPMSTSALLVSGLTQTSIFKNIPLMIKSSVIPFILTCVIYLLAGYMIKPNAAASSVVEEFANNFSLIWVTILPAALIVALSAFKVDVRITIAISIVCGGIICTTNQNMSFSEVLKVFALGYVSKEKDLAAMLDGGGILSMLKPAGIVFLSSTYSGIFEGTGMLSGIKKYIHLLAERINPFGAYILTSVFTAMVSCNQTLAIMLTDQLCGDLAGNNTERAISLENSAVIISPLIPWCIAGAVPLAAIGAPTSGIIFAAYLFLVPIYNYLTGFIRQRVRTL